MFTVSFLREGVTKVGYHDFLPLNPNGIKPTCPRSSVAGLMTFSRHLGKHVRAQTY